MAKQPTYREHAKSITALEAQYAEPRFICDMRHDTAAEQKKDKSAFRESEDRFRLAFMTSPDAISINRLEDGVYIDINDGFMKMMGYEPDEVIGKASIDLNIWKNPEDRKKLVRELRTRGFIDNLEVEFSGKNGTTIYGLMSARTLTTNNEKVILSITRDITERKISEKALRQSENYMRSIFQAAPIGIGVVHNRIILQVNDRFCEMLGYLREELVGQESKRVYPDDDEYERVGREKYKQISRSGTGTIETRLMCKDGREIDVLLSSTPIETNNLNAGVTFTALDITSFKNIQAALQRSKTKYRTMVETFKSPVYICSQDYRIQYMNSAMIDRVGYNATGALCYEAMHGFQKRCQWCDCEQTFEKGHSEKDIVSPKDNRSFNISCTVFKNEDGSMSKLSVCRDTTEFIALQNRLQQAQKLEAIGTLASGIAHDFNNILFPIIGMSDLLMEDLPPGSLVSDYAKEINKAGLRAKELVSQILSFSRKSEQVMTPVKFQLIIKEVLKLCRSTIPINIEIEQKIQIDCGAVMANPTQLHQIGMNLITNAYQAVQDKNGKITVVLEEIDLNDCKPRRFTNKSGRYALFTVTDNGIGMTEEIKKKVFDPYFTTKAQGKGVGLGLAVVYGIVKEYGGEIEIETKMGAGTSFKIYLPLKKHAKDKHAENIKAILETGHEHILLVDDEDAVAKLQQEILERLGYKVTRRTNSVEALNDFKLNPSIYDIVLTDMSMPNMTGEQLTYEIRQIRPEIPIIICTGFSERIDKEQSLKIGIDGFLMKPIVKSEMSQMVRNVLDKSKPTQVNSVMTKQALAFSFNQ